MFFWLSKRITPWRFSLFPIVNTFGIKWWIFFCYVRLEGTCHASNSESFGIFIFSRNQLEEWLLNDHQTETGQKSMAFWPASFAYGTRCLGFWPFEATKKKKFRFFRHNRLDGAQEMENGDFFRVPVFFVGFLSFQNLKFSIHQKVRFPLERFRTWIYRRRFFFLGCFAWCVLLVWMFLARWLGDILVDGYVTNGCTGSGGQAIQAGCVARIFRTGRDKN